MASAWRVIGLVLLLAAGCRGRPPVVAITERELMAELTYTEEPGTHTWRTFRPRPGARIPAEGIWQRYAPFIGIPSAALVQIRPARPHGIIPGAVLIDYQQRHLGYPVGGYGYSVAVKDGLLWDGAGKVMTGLPMTLPAPISRERAAEIALAHVDRKGPWPSLPLAVDPNAPWPWVAAPGRWTPPQQHLVLGSLSFQPRGIDFQLLWEFSFSGSGLLGPGTMTIDAVTGAVLATTSGLIE
jgi:hypothetical protein